MVLQNVRVMKKCTLRKEVSLQDAQSSEKNMLVELDLARRQQEFFTCLNDSRYIIATAVARHINASRPPSCEVSPRNKWKPGSFNVCIPVDVTDHPIQRVIIRFPLPYKVGELHFPGNADEKLVTEAATYAWLDEHCPEVPKPQLLGYALSNGRCFTRLDYLSLPLRLLMLLRRKALKWLGWPIPCQYFSHGSSGLSTGYLLLEDVQKEGIAILSDTWMAYYGESTKRRNLFHDLARIMLAIGRVPMPRIGSLTIDKSGYLQLNNRPLTMTLYQLENEGINTGIGRSDTFSSSIDYGMDLVNLHDQNLRAQPNAISSGGDGKLQMATFACMRMLLPHFFSRSMRNGPFIFQLSDIHPSNLFVDQDWHITSVIDLEYAAALPREMEVAPYWLNPGQDLGNLGSQPEGFNAVHDEFTAIFREEEHCQSEHLSPRAEAMQQAWETKAFFYQHSLNERIGCIHLFQLQVLPLFEPEFVLDPTFVRHIMPLWSIDGKRALAQKIRDKDRYHQAVQELFEE